MTFQPVREITLPKTCFSKWCAFPDDNLKSTLPIHMKFDKKVYYLDVGKSLTFGTFLPQGHLQSHLLVFAINLFPVIFGEYLEFVYKCIYLENSVR